LINKKLKYAIIILLLLLSIFDLWRFFQKFNPFSPSSFTYPKNSILELVKKDRNNFKILLGISGENI
ncbi:MAG: hypothetical protein Q7T50_02300, partial [Candidatus Magasanikbacteria bacterium]|nr:hypothetical protein [Candidatus Magasanikbacteria bacterium]